MICFLRNLVDPKGGKNASLAQVADHVVYAGEKIGYSHVGIGSDFDGMLEGPKGLDGPSDYPQLVAELFNRGISKEQVKMVLGLSIIRVLEEVENFARQALNKMVPMLCDSFPEVWTSEQKETLITKAAERKARGR